MARSQGEGEGEAQDAEVATTPAGEESPEERAEKLKAKRQEQADAAVEAAEAKVERAKEHLEGAKASVEKMKAHRASLEE